MKLEEVIKKVEECPSSIFTLEDALKLIENIDDNENQLTEKEINSLKGRFQNVVDDVLDDSRLFELIEVSDTEITLEWDELKLESVSFELYYFKQKLHNTIENLIV